MTLLRTHPEVAVLMLYLLAVAAHVAVGAALHGFRLHDFDWHKFGAFAETDLASTRAKVIGVTFVGTVATSLLNGSSAHAAFTPAFLALCGSCAAATLPVARDTLYEVVQLVSGTNVKPAASLQPLGV